RRTDDRGGGGQATTGDVARRVGGEPCLDQVAGVEEACRWIEIYGEMTLFWEQTRAQLASWLDAVTLEPARELLVAVDQSLIEERCERLRRRLHLWEQRAQELVTNGAPDGATAEK